MVSLNVICLFPLCFTYSFHGINDIAKCEQSAFRLPFTAMIESVIIIYVSPTVSCSVSANRFRFTCGNIAMSLVFICSAAFLISSL